jgi:ABC-type uncharacterized transport system YnjBCD ATPase subunit
VLEVKNLEAFYGKSHILHGVHFAIGQGEIVSLLGRNGVGRSTTIKAIMGMVTCEGSVKFKGEELVGLKTFEIAHKGLGYVPENRDIFPTLTVRQNLVLGMKGSTPGERWKEESMFELFPRLQERADTQAGVLSGGEQQMLTLCRTLMGDPDADHDRRADRRPRAEDRRAGARPLRGDPQARHLDPAGRAEARHRARHLGALLRHGARPDRVRRQPAGREEGRSHAQGVAGSLKRFRPAASRAATASGSCLRPGHSSGRHGRQPALRNDDRRGRLAAQILQLAHRALDCFLRFAAEFLRRFVERLRFQRKRDRQRADLAQHLRLADPLDFPLGVARAIALHRRQLAQRSDAPVRVDLLHPEVLRIHVRVGHAFFRAGCHRSLDFESDFP